MNAVEFCTSLAMRISPDEWRALEAADRKLLINDHNRSALLEMRDMAEMRHAPFPEQRDSGQPSAPGALPADDVDWARAEALSAELQSYLDEHMAEAPEGHKWIILASLYLTYVAKRPMHPIERAGVMVQERDGRTVYLCPNKTPGDNPICDACICAPAKMWD